VATQELEQECLALQFGKVEADALVVAATERNPLVKMLLVFGACGGKTLRVKLVWIAPVLFHVMGMQRNQTDHGVGRDAITLEFHVLGGTTWNYGEWRIHAQGFLEHPGGFL